MTSPVRTCVGCRRRSVVTDLIRLTVNAERRVVVSRNLPGRGAWLHDDERCAELADRSFGVSRTLKVGRNDLEAICAQTALKSFRNPEGTTPSNPPFAA